MVLHGKSRQSALLGAAAVSAVSSVSEASLAQSDGRWKSGEEVYVKVCGYCHEAGRVGPELKGRDFPPEIFSTFARHGPLAMPSFRTSEIDDRSLNALSEYLAKAPAPTR